MNPYFEQTILCADPVELIGMIYQQAIASVREARQHLEHKKIRERSAAIMRAYTAVAELLAALRPATAPEMTGRLQSLYSYMLQRLLDANMQQADPPLSEVLALLITLAEGWSGVAAKLAPKEATGDMKESTRRSVANRWAEGEPAGHRAGSLALCA